MSGHTPWSVIRDARFRSTPEDAARYDARRQVIRERIAAGQCWQCGATLTDDDGCDACEA